MIVVLKVKAKLYEDSDITKNKSDRSKKYEHSDDQTNVPDIPLLHSEITGGDRLKCSCRDLCLSGRHVKQIFNAIICLNPKVLACVRKKSHLSPV